MNQLERQRVERAVKSLETAFETDPPYIGPAAEKLCEAQYEAVTRALQLLRLNLR